MKKYGIPFLIIVLSGWLVRLETSFLTGSAQTVIVNLTIACSMFGFGISIQPHHKTRTWVKKLIISFLFIFLIIWDMGYIRIVGLNSVFDILCLNSKFVLYLYYVFMGWLFFE